MKAQSAMEFLIIFMIFVAALAIIAAITLNKTREISTATIELETKKILNEISDKINIVFLEGHGFSTNITVSEKIFSRNYTIWIASNNVYLQLDGTVYAGTILTRNVTITDPGGLLEKGEHTLRNENGIVVIR